MRCNLITRPISYSAEETIKRSSRTTLNTTLFQKCPPQIPYAHLTSTAYAEDLGDQLNTYGGK